MYRVEYNQTLGAWFVIKQDGSFRVECLGKQYAEATATELNKLHICMSNALIQMSCRQERNIRLGVE